MKHSLMSTIECMCGLGQYFWRIRKGKEKIKRKETSQKPPTYIYDVIYVKFVCVCVCA